MKKILVLTLLIGSVVMAKDACFDQDLKKIKEVSAEAKKLKKETGTMSKIKYAKKIADIAELGAHVKEKHPKEMKGEAKKEIEKAINEFTK
ncbi:MAG: hypothetical protein ACRC0S_08160 [Fusobacteriaceae bacterium]